MRHPKGTRAHVLLSSVFKPFARDDEFGSRTINPVELYHNQVTREQGPFSLRMFHRSWGLMFIQQNISAPSTLLDFPTRERFVRELRRHRYDIVGISGIVVNVGKVREMCRLVREHSPDSTVVVGGHITSTPALETIVDADHIVRGEGVSWMRRFLGEDPDRPFVHPAIPSSFGFRVMGLPSPRGGGHPAATIVPSVGCPLGCNFCTTSAFFGGKGRFVSFYERGDDLFRVMCDIERRLGVSCFFMMDENFLLYKRRALELLERMKAHGAGGRRHRRHARAVQVHLPPPGDLTGRIQDPPRPGVPDRLRAQRPEPLPADADDVRPVAAVSRGPRPTGPGARPAGGPAVPGRLPRGALGDGAISPRVGCRSRRASPPPAARCRERTGTGRVRGDAGARATAALDVPPEARRSPSGRRREPRTFVERRTPEPA